MVATLDRALLLTFCNEVLPIPPALWTVACTHFLVIDCTAACSLEKMMISWRLYSMLTTVSVPWNKVSRRWYFPGRASAGGSSLARYSYRSYAGLFLYTIISVFLLLPVRWPLSVCQHISSFRYDYYYPSCSGVGLFLCNTSAHHHLVMITSDLFPKAPR